MEFSQQLLHFHFLPILPDLMVWLLHVEFIIDLNDIRGVVSPTIRLYLLSCHNMF